MKLVQLFNQYRSRHGGEERVVRDIDEILKARGVDASLVLRSSRDLEGHPWRQARAFFGGAYSPSAARWMTRLLEEEKPDVVHVHNLYPLFSPSVLVSCRKAGVPVVMSLHNYALTCPAWSHLSHGKLCLRCLGGREYWCVLKNCLGNPAKSAAYALRSMIARKWRLFEDNVTLFIALSHAAKRHMVRAGFAEDQIAVVPNRTPIPERAADPAEGRYAGFSGRLCPEKDVGTLLAAAARTADIPVRLAGDGPLADRLKKAAGPNVTFLGRIGYSEMTEFYRGARFLVLPSACLEMCPLSVLEAMALGIPVIGADIGGIPELVEDGVTGFLFRPATQRNWRAGCAGCGTTPACAAPWERRPGPRSFAITALISFQNGS